MEAENFNKWRIADLKQLLLQFNITDVDIEGSGKNGNVVRKDYVQTISKIMLSLSPTKMDSNPQTNINEDIWYNIMLHLNYTDLKKSCLTDKTAMKVCNNISFWKNKFENEHLEIIGKIPTTLKEWIKKYKIASTSSLIANRITHVLQHDQYTITAYIELGFDVLKIIPEYEKNIKKARSRFVGDFLAVQGFSIKSKNGLQFKFFYQNDNGDLAGKFTTMITFDQLYFILYRYLHYFPSKTLIDQNELSYDLNELKKLLIKLKKEHKTQPTIKLLEEKIKLYKN